MAGLDKAFTSASQARSSLINEEKRKYACARELERRLHEGRIDRTQISFDLSETLARKSIIQAQSARDEQARRQAKLRKDGTLPWARPDAKSQVTIEYDDAGKPKRIDAVVLSTQHAESISHKDLKEAITEEVIKPVLPAKLIDRRTKFWVNPTGRFVVGGPYGDAGLTGRKIIVDTYGGAAPHGGGAFSGKDPS